MFCRDNLEFNLLSVKIERHFFKVLFDNADVTLLNNNSEVVTTGNLIGNLYMIKFQIDTSTALLTSNVDLMHRRMCNSSCFPPKNFCNIYRKQTIKSVKRLPLIKKPTRILEVDSSDGIGAITLPTYNSKSQGFHEKFEEYEAITAKYETRISRIRCDNKGECSSRQFTDFCKSKGIQIDEHFNRTLLDSVRCILLDSKVEKKFWGEAVCAATYKLNRTPTRVLKERRPADLWYGYCESRKIRVFGTVTYDHIPKEDVKGKLHLRLKLTIMMGYTANGYRLWDNSKCKIVIACCIKFLEETEPCNVESKSHESIILTYLRTSSNG
ncbi:hypothetical protein PR048_001420 [Dryococelus australis]|uniref:Retroviral polymerase SH3-like domain-containing protein n=1 Tax=Dryococelus australis TaxID=614101 RepID=A0ABQ9IJQ3_9NEOP|nr:hypothetical protein PR048_001420 [Dryococelus australis]